MEGTLYQLRSIHIVAVNSSVGKYHYVTITAIVVISRPDEWTFSSDFFAVIILSYLMFGSDCFVIPSIEVLR